MFSTILSGGIHGIYGHLMEVEVDLSKSMPAFDMVGLLSAEAKEARERVRIALKNSGIELPPVHITVNISPANIRKEGTSYDLPIAIGIMTALGYIPEEAVKEYCFIGELGLNAEIRPIRGALPIIKAAAQNQIKKVILPQENAEEGSIIEEMEVYGASSLSEVCQHLLSPSEHLLKASHIDVKSLIQKNENNYPDFKDVIGQEGAKRAALIAAAGFHHMLLTGPPGSGKTMIAKRLPGIMPALTKEECIEITSVYSVAGLLEKDCHLISKRPFFSPHHSVTATTLTGGGIIPKPGIFSLSHKGVLFLDELPEFNRSCIEIMRQPLEEKQIHLARMGGSFSYPANFLLVAACNPCPCGHYPDRHKCHCSENEIRRYQNKISGPIRDRIDINVLVEGVSLSSLQNGLPGMGSLEMKEIVMRAHSIQKKRFQGTQILFNSEIPEKYINHYCSLDSSAESFLEQIFIKQSFSMRSYHKILKLARTIADIDQSGQIQIPHLSEAVYYSFQQEDLQIESR